MRSEDTGSGCRLMSGDWRRITSCRRLFLVHRDCFLFFQWHRLARCGWSTAPVDQARIRSEEHTSELQSLMRISYAVFCLKKKIHKSDLQVFMPPTIS